MGFPVTVHSCRSSLTVKTLAAIHGQRSVNEDGKQKTENRKIERGRQWRGCFAIR